MKKILNGLKKMSIGQWVFSSLWFLTGIVLIILISFLGAYSKPTIPSQINLVASFGFIFTLLIIASVFATVIVQYQKNQIKSKKKGVKND